MRLKVVSDGANVKIVDEDGRHVEGVHAVEFTWALGDPPLLRLTFVADVQLGFQPPEEGT